LPFPALNFESSPRIIFLVVRGPFRKRSLSIITTHDSGNFASDTRVERLQTTEDSFRGALKLSLSNCAKFSEGKNRNSLVRSRAS